MIDYVKDLDVKKDLDVLKENGIELGERAEYVYKVQNKVLKAGVLGGYTPKEIGSFMTKVYRSSRTKKGPRTIIDVMNSMSGVPEAWSTEESEQLELIKEKTESALDYNKSQKVCVCVIRSFFFLTFSSSSNDLKRFLFCFCVML